MANAFLTAIPDQVRESSANPKLRRLLSQGRVIDPVFPPMVQDVSNACGGSDGTRAAHLALGDRAANSEQLLTTVSRPIGVRVRGVVQDLFLIATRRPCPARSRIQCSSCALSVHCYAIGQRAAIGALVDVPLVWHSEKRSESPASLTHDMRALVNTDKLRMLFQSYRNGNDDAFLRTAETIIADELASNHHHAATELQQALGKGQGQMNANVRAMELGTSPKDRRSGDDLLSIQESSVTPDRVILAKGTGLKISRVLEEHRGRMQLQKYGYSPKTKLLFWGPPGTGKTLTAHLLAYELGLPIAVLRLNTVISSFLGDTAAHLHRVFNRANSMPMVLLLDEFDAIGKNRDDPHDVGELKRVVNSLLQAMDAFRGTQSILIAASNHQYLLDPGLWRRFDDIVEFPLPSLDERRRLLCLLLNGVRSEFSAAAIGTKMAQLSQADIEHVVKESVKTMILQGREYLRSRDITDELKLRRTALTTALRKNRSKVK